MQNLLEAGEPGGGVGGEATGRRGLTAAAGRRRARSCDAHHPPGPQAPPPARPAPLGPLALPGSPGEEPGLCTRRLLEKNSTDGGFEPASSAHSLTHIEVTARRPLGLRWPPVAPSHILARGPGDPGPATTQPSVPITRALASAETPGSVSLDVSLSTSPSPRRPWALDIGVSAVSHTGLRPRGKTEQKLSARTSS